MKKLLLVFSCLSCVFLSGCNPADWKAKSGLQVTTNDVPASLFLDGKYLDKVPYINNDIKPGEYTLEIRPDSSQLVSYTTKVSLKNGLLTVVVWKPGDRPETSGGVLYEMEKLGNPKQSQLSLVTIPDSAIIHVDGESKDFAPVLIDSISAGEHGYEVSLPSYETQKNTINVLEGYRMNVTVKLARQDLTPAATPEASPSL